MITRYLVVRRLAVLGSRSLRKSPLHGISETCHAIEWQFLAQGQLGKRTLSWLRLKAGILLGTLPDDVRPWRCSHLIAEGTLFCFE